MMSWFDRTTRYVMLLSATNCWRAVSSTVSVTTPITTTSSRAAFESVGICLTHGLHQVAQKLITTTLPASSGAEMPADGMVGRHVSGGAHDAVRGSDLSGGAA